MAVRRRAIRLDVERIVIEGLPLASRARFARAFEAECAMGLATAHFTGRAIAGERISLRVAHDASPETVGRDLARAVVRLVRHP